MLDFLPLAAVSLASLVTDCLDECSSLGQLLCCFDEHGVGIWEKSPQTVYIAHKSPYPYTTSYTINQSLIILTSNSHDYNHIQGLWSKGNADYIAIFHIMLGGFPPEALGGCWAVSIRCLRYFVLCPIPRENQRQFSILKYPLCVIELLGTAWNYPMMCYEIWMF